MPAPSSPPASRRSASRATAGGGAASGRPSANGASPGARANYANPGMRISDAERSEVADRLSQHYGDGRLDQEEFSRRLDQAMNATHQSDLNGLFADLPEHDPKHVGAMGPQPPQGAVPPHAGPRPALPRRPRRRTHSILTLILIIVVAAIIGHAAAQLAIPWILIGVLAFIWLWTRQRGPRQR
jgi:uncharacterized protein DUF1707